jgi:ADP-ribose pyrophosphatase YjhB (NUDIX family)
VPNKTAGEVAALPGGTVLDMPDGQSATSGARVSTGLVGVVRPIAAAVIRDGSRILVWDDYNPATGEVVSVPLAGGIEFGETGEQAIARELAEEIRATPTRIQFLGLLEDIFDWAEQQRHELYLVYDVDLADQTIYDAEQVEVLEPDGTTYPARWRSLPEFRSDARLVPDGLLDLISEAMRPRAGD